MSEEHQEEMLPIPDAFGEGVQQVEHPAAHVEQTASGEQVVISAGWHMRLVNGNLFITAAPPSTLQVVLNAIAASDLLAYLSRHEGELFEHREALLALMQQPEPREPGQKVDPSV
jgi:hypothetical protein